MIASPSWWLFRHWIGCDLMTCPWNLCWKSLCVPINKIVHYKDTYCLVINHQHSEHFRVDIRTSKTKYITRYHFKVQFNLERNNLLRLCVACFRVTLALSRTWIGLVTVSTYAATPEITSYFSVSRLHSYYMKLRIWIKYVFPKKRKTS